ncbi:YqaA family protein [uncultured Pseudomonas sp.]|uniref:YqaA family protein n=1 Tax=uncultured Pseudomonas sp. TaxID=114707 RepID=UPI0025D81AC2|nr:YqaA family protein [uncultured Pseudomonas sp.]
MAALSIYLGLAALAFGAATLLPLQSEAALAGLLLTERYATTALLLAATLGNVAGSTLNWWLGRHLERFRQRRWFPLPPERLVRIQGAYRRYGWWSLLLSWTPVIGDPLTLVAGVMREPLWRFLLVVTLAKAIRYGVVAWLALGWS